jgi:hypothetical protein
MEVVEGKILQVMESWPLQLVVDVPSGHLDVLLSDDTTVIQAGRSVDPNALTPGLVIRLRGHHLAERSTTFLATEISLATTL